MPFDRAVLGLPKRGLTGFHSPSSPLTSVVSRQFASAVCFADKVSSLVAVPHVVGLRSVGGSSILQTFVLIARFVFGARERVVSE